MYNTSKYYSYIYIYADRNVRPWMIQGYTLATFPKVVQYIFMHNLRRNRQKNLALDCWTKCMSYNHLCSHRGMMMHCHQHLSSHSICIRYLPAHKHRVWLCGNNLLYIRKDIRIDNVLLIIVNVYDVLL